MPPHSQFNPAQLAKLGVATVYEAAGRAGLINVPLFQILPGTRVAGPARTVLCGPGDNLMVHAVMDRVRPGEVLVLSMPDPEAVALVGELLATQAKQRQASAMLVNAAVRDTEELVSLGLPIWARFIRASGATKKHIGSLDVPVEIGGTTIHSGDIVVLDADGAVSVPKERFTEVLEATEQRVEREAAMRRKLEAGALSYDLHGLRRLVEGDPSHG